MTSFHFSRILMMFLGLALVMALPLKGAHADDKVHKIDFWMAHKPDNTDNVQLIESFAKRVKDKTGGKVIITPTVVKSGINRPNSYTIRKIYDGEAIMSQVSVKTFYPMGMSDQIDVLDMPLLFRDHDHATKVLDGKIGKDLMETVHKGSNGMIRGLAFTYSGGFRNYFSTQAIESIAAMRGKQMRNLGGRMSRDLVFHLGVANYVSPAGSDVWVQDHKVGNLELDESEVIRLAQYKRKFPEMFGHIKTVLETNHNLFLTLIVINDALLNTLTPEQQAIIQQEADVLAVQERELSIRQEAESKAAFEKEGIVFISMSEDDKRLLKQAAGKVHEKYESSLGKWISAIRAVK